MSTTAIINALSSSSIARLCTALLLITLVTLAAPVSALPAEGTPNPGQTADPRAPWDGAEEWLVDALSHGMVLHTEPIGSGITNPFKVELEFEEHRIHAVWKPLRANQFDTYESYPAEVAAYRLSKYLGLDMVPPTVRRKIGRRWGSLQLWVDGHLTFADAEPTKPFDFFHSDHVQLMHFFDALIDNPDRNAGNFLVDDQYRVVLIDHSRSLNFEATERQREGAMPMRFQTGVVKQLKAIDMDVLDQLLGDLLTRSDLRSLNLSAKRLARFVDNEIVTHGPGIQFHRVRPAKPAPLTLTHTGNAPRQEP